MERADLVYRMAFASVRGMNRALADDLIARLGSEREFFEASETRLRYITSSRSRIYTADYRAERLRDAEAEERFVASHGIKAIYYTDAEYPERLADCDDAPLMLYAVGNTDLNSSRLVAVVGTRHATPYGIDFTNRLVEELAECTDGVVIVSGLAYGIDVADCLRWECLRTALTPSIPPTIGPLRPIWSERAVCCLRSISLPNRCTRVILWRETALWPAWPTVWWWSSRPIRAAR